MKLRSQTQQSAPMNVKLYTRYGDFVSIVDLLRHNLRIALGLNGCGSYWMATISGVCFIFTTISQVISLIHAIDDAEKMFKCFSVIWFCCMGLLKLYSLRRKQQRWYSLQSSASHLEIRQLIREDSMKVDYESEDEENDIFQQKITKYTQKYISTSNLLIKIYTVTLVIYILSPFVEYVIWKLKGVDVLEYPHILPVWTGLEKVFFPIYVITIISEGISAVYCVCVHTVFDLSVVGMMIFIHGQFLLLRECCERIGGEGRKCDLSLKRDLRAHFRISRCQRIHNSLIELVIELSNLTKNVLGIYFNVSTLALCSVALQVLSNELSTTQLLMLLQYMCAILIQLFLFCYYGDDVINESSVGLGEGPSASAWWCLSSHVRREVSLLCVSMSRRCRLMAGPFHFVNLPAFIQIVRTAYSCYAVIGQKSSN